MLYYLGSLVWKQQIFSKTDLNKMGNLLAYDIKGRIYQQNNIREEMQLSNLENGSTDMMKMKKVHIK